KARKKELASRPEPNEKVYEITLKQTDEPGLPPPVTRTNHLASAKNGAGQAEPKLKPGELIASTTKDVAKSPPEKEATAAEPKTDDDEDSVDDKIPSLDIPLEETKRILVDYIRLITKQGGLA